MITPTKVEKTKIRNSRKSKTLSAKKVVNCFQLSIFEISETAYNKPLRNV